MQTRTEKEPTICCSKCGTTVRENPYTDMILVLSQFLFVGLFKVRISKCRTEKDVQTRTEKEPLEREIHTVISEEEAQFCLQLVDLALSYVRNETDTPDLHKTYKRDLTQTNTRP